MPDKSVNDDKTEGVSERVDTDRIAADARLSERKRFSTVQGSEHYSGREALAHKMLSETDMTGEQIVSMLETVPKPESPVKAKEVAAPEKKRNHFAEAMEKQGTPGISEADNEDASVEEGDDMPSASVDILAAYRASGGQVRNPERDSRIG